MLQRLYCAKKSSGIWSGCRLWLTRSRAGPDIQHFQQAPWCCLCCWSSSHILSCKTLDDTFILFLLTSQIPINQKICLRLHFLLLAHAIISGLWRDPVSEPISPSPSLSFSISPSAPQDGGTPEITSSPSRRWFLMPCSWLHPVTSRPQPWLQRRLIFQVWGLFHASVYVLALQTLAVKITVVSKYRTILVLHCCVTNHHTQGTFKQHPSICLHFCKPEVKYGITGFSAEGTRRVKSRVWGNPLLGSFQLLQNQGSCCRVTMVPIFSLALSRRLLSGLFQSFYHQSSNGTLKPSCGLNLWLLPPAWESPLPFKGSCDFVRQAHLDKSSHFKVIWIWIWIVSAKSLHSSTYISIWLNNPQLRIWGSHFKILPEQIK